MLDTLCANLVPVSDSDSIGVFLLLVVVIALIEAALVAGVLYVFYFLLTLPIRRNERTRLFLDLLELGLKDGHTPERAVTDASASHDEAPGVLFHLVAAHIEKGLTLTAALDKVRGFLPRPIIDMLKTGQRIGSMEKVLPACRKHLKDGVSQVRGALNYLLALTFLLTPTTVLIPVMINVFILPKFKEVFTGMAAGMPLPAFTQFIFGSSHLLLIGQIGFTVLIWLLMLAYVGGPRVQNWFQSVLPGLSDRIQHALPWRRKRLHRDFSAMLAVLLDAEVPEPEAITLAANTTGNSVIRRGAERALAELRSGVKLPAALRLMDESGELQWRLANALRQGRGFLLTLTGWHEALDAKAFQLEQAAAQILTSALVLFNGAVVAGVVIAIFLALIDLISNVALW